MVQDIRHQNPTAHIGPPREPVITEQEQVKAGIEEVAISHIVESMSQEPLEEGGVPQQNGNEEATIERENKKTEIDQDLEIRGEEIQAISAYIGIQIVVDLRTCS
ncbi:hypothetical protein L873DRAFT_1844314 [Choiromyces venosus 120613-1]|uniref:Uncharacterized protein n=1 Tax=Choiromyces venosus 120613-1 TaxID=1336337 RepID=A0A3N4JLU6_9PEZI|nr:hypothetical protein L873DRAFT_1844314 [Choiromyces venosus 120613-1]